MATSDGTPITVVLADEDELMWEGLQATLSRNERLQMVGEVKGGVVPAAQRLQPDLIIADPRSDVRIDRGLLAQLQRVASKSCIVIFSRVDELSEVIGALQAGAYAYFLKSRESHSEPIGQALTLVADHGFMVLDPGIAERRRSLPPAVLAAPVGPVGQTLTAREREVLALLVRGLADKEIADSLSITTSTVDYHVHQLCLKLGARSRAQLGFVAARHGLVVI